MHEDAEQVHKRHFQLASVMTSHSSAVLAIDGERESGDYITRLELACIACAEAGVDAEAVVPMREALAKLGCGIWALSRFWCTADESASSWRRCFRMTLLP